MKPRRCTVQLGHAASVMRLVPRISGAALILGAAQACLLLNSLDDYADSSVDGVEPFPAPTTDATPDASRPETSERSDAPIVTADAGCAAVVDTKSDPLHCGACNRRCANGAACIEGRCPIETVVDAGTPVLDLSVVRSPDAGSNPVVYFTGQNGTVGQRFVDEQLGADTEDAGATGPIRAVRTGNSLGFFAQAGAIAKFGAPTFTTKLPNTFAITSGRPRALLNEGSFTFWSDSAGLHWKNIRNESPDAGTFDLGAASPPPSALAVSGDTLFWSTSDGVVREMQVFFPGTPKVIQPDPIGKVSAIAATRTMERTFIYLCLPGQGLLFFEQQLAGCTLRATLPMEDCEAIAVTPTNVYAVNLGRIDLNPRKYGELWRTSLDGTEPLLLADGLRTSRALDAYGEFIYFTTESRVVRTTH